MQTVARAASLLVNPERHPLRSSNAVRAFGTTVVVAPHPDDESLGCGGLLALLADAGVPAHVIFMTDGSRSHPNSAAYPPALLADLREVEARSAVVTLGLPESAAHFLRFGDCGLPAEDTPACAPAVAQIRIILDALAPETLLIPWRRDPHCDHESTWRLLRAVAADWPRPLRWLEYPVWAWTQADGEAAPRADEGHAWRLDISSVLARKERAVAQHRSQLGKVIGDDPEGFVLQPAMLAHFARPWELFIEPSDG